jgi:hypothetical protein
MDAIVASRIIFIALVDLNQKLVCIFISCFIAPDAADFLDRLKCVNPIFVLIYLINYRTALNCPIKFTISLYFWSLFS